jgi:uncharacterized membrane protein YphA (DoxX/SURF4 family)
MKTLNSLIDKLEISSSNWMKKNGMHLLRLSIGIIFFWFGILKFFPGLSPAQDLAIRTISILTFGLMPAKVSIITLATWEVLIGLGFLSGRFLKLTLLLLFAQMVGTFMPVFILPNEVFTAIPYAPTLEGQYIIKNIVVVSAGIVIGANVLKSKRE